MGVSTIGKMCDRTSTCPSSVGPRIPKQKVWARKVMITGGSTVFVIDSKTVPGNPGDAELIVCGERTRLNSPKYLPRWTGNCRIF